MFGEATASSGSSYGVYGRSNGANGRGVYGLADNGSGNNVGVFGQTRSPNGYAGYFLGGRNYFEGNVGIGTNDPSWPLHVSTSRAIGIKSSTTGAIAIEGFTSDELGTGVQGIADSVGVRGITKASSGRGVHGLAAYATGTNYGVRGTTNSADGFAGYFEGGRNYFQGRVGIGTEFPQAKVQIDSDVDEDAFRVRVGGGTKFVIKSNGRTAVGANSTPIYQFQVFGEGSAGKPGGGSWSIPSDRRLKKNIHDLTGSLEKLLKLRSVTFEYKDPEAINEISGTRLGMIAQEVEEIFPDWVSTAGNGYKTLTFRGFEALTVNAFRELHKEKDDEIASLRTESETKISMFNERNVDLEARMAQLEALVAKLAHSRSGTN